MRGGRGSFKGTPREWRCSLSRVMGLVEFYKDS